jgi:hypothetical protein
VFTEYSALVSVEAVKGAEGGQVKLTGNLPARIMLISFPKVVCLDLPSESNELAKKTLKKFGLLGRTVTIIEGDGAGKSAHSHYSLPLSPPMAYI